MSEPMDLPDVKKILDDIKGNYYLQEEGECIPVCKGCFNERGPCGTPCFGCERQEAWTKEWKMFLALWNTFYIYKRKESDKT